VRPVAIGDCPGAGAHEGHEVIASGRPVGPPGHPRGLLTVWRCPVDGWGGYWHDFGRDPMKGIGGGPVLETLPGEPAHDDEPEGRRRLFRRN
jgi:hypothetical protein